MVRLNIPAMGRRHQRLPQYALWRGRGSGRQRLYRRFPQSRRPQGERQRHYFDRRRHRNFRLLGRWRARDQRAVKPAFGLALDSAGNLYIADSNNYCIRKLDTNGNISTVAGVATNLGFSGDGGPATSAKMSSPYGIAVDKAGNLYIADSGNNRIRKVSNGIMTTIAGTGSAGFSGDGGTAAKR